MFKKWIQNIIIYSSIIFPNKLSYFVNVFWGHWNNSTYAYTTSQSRYNTWMGKAFTRGITVMFYSFIMLVQSIWMTLGFPSFIKKVKHSAVTNWIYCSEYGHDLASYVLITKILKFTIPVQTTLYFTNILLNFHSFKHFWDRYYSTYGVRFASYQSL